MCAHPVISRRRDMARKSSNTKRQPAGLPIKGTCFYLLGFLLACPSLLFAIDLSNDPMETKVKSAPSNIMFVLDNSGSMDWEFATKEDEGRFYADGQYHEYLYYNTDYTYSSGATYGTVLSGDNRRYWRSQWSGYNKLYYNQNQVYQPWPGKTGVSLSNLRQVRSNPQNSSPTFDLTSTYRTIGAVNVSHMHYYAWDDANSNKIVDNGEIYLVNFTWNNNGATVDAGELTRKYYKFTEIYDIYHRNNYVEGDELSEVTGGAIPDAVRAKQIMEDGSKDYLSVDEEALNFANWFGFYRKRSMAAKYAVAAAINDFSYVNVGFYTINDNSEGARIGVKPVHAELKSIVVDNKDNGFSSSSSSHWSESGHSGEYLNSSSVTNTLNAWATWTPNIPASGDYKVYAWWVDSSGNRDRNACYKIQHAGGNTGCIRKNQREDVSKFNLLGTYTFTKGNTGYVQVLRDSSSTASYTSADAVMFVPVGTVLVDETDTLQSKLYDVISEGSTPLRTAFNNVGRYFDVEDTGGFAPAAPDPSTPYCSAAEGGACQQAFAIVMTDGYYNDTFSSVGNVDNGMTAPFGDSYSNTLADVAMKFYNDDLADNLANELPTNNYDKRTSQHLVTYTVAFGVDGSIPLTDMNKDGTLDAKNCNYADDPYFLNACTPKPSWPNPDTDDTYKIDDLWHASINGRGQFFNASNPEELTAALKDITKNIKSRMASGASVSVNGEELNDGTVLYQATYDPGKWIGNVVAYPVNKTTGEILRADGQELWQASDKLQAKPWSDRLIFTSNGDKSGIAFTYSALDATQKVMLGSSSDVVDHLRGNEIANMRVRDKKLGDIVHSSPLLTGTVKPAANDGIDNDGDGKIDEAGESIGGTIFAGGNDGMLHAFNAQTGEERFAFIPNLVFDHLADLTKSDYSHRFYVDATPVAKTLTFAAGDRSKDGLDNDGDGSVDETDENYSDSQDNNNNGTVDEPAEKKTVTMLVGGLGRGGKGYYALDISGADQVTSTTPMSTLTAMVKWEYPRRYFDGIDNDGDGKIDEADEGAATRTYEYSYAGNQTSAGGSNYSDNRDNNGDGNVDELGEKAVYIKTDGLDNDNDGIIDEADEKMLAYRDDDLGYSFSTPVIVRSHRTKNPASLTDHPWIVLFGNGYESHNGRAVLYILDVLTGELIRKIDTGVGGSNGLSSPVAVDVNDDDRVDFVYAGDLKGNLWKFDLTSNDPSQWRVAHKNSSGVVQPMFSAPGQPITIRPDVMYHPTKHGYMVTFGTGKFLGESDRTNQDPQTIFGIWDYGDSSDHLEYPGSWDRATNTLSNISGVKLQKQSLVDERYSTFDGSYLRTVSAHVPHWYLVDDPTNGEKGNPASITAYNSDNIDNDNDTRVDETSECDMWSGTTCLGHTDTETQEGTGHVGWYFDLPGRGTIDGKDNDGDGLIDEANEKTSIASERVIKDVIIRDGKLIVLSFIPDASPCSGGGTTVMHEFNASTGGRLTRPVFDITGDKIIDDNDYILIGGQQVAVTGIGFQGMLHPPVFLGMDKEREMKIFSSSSGTTEVVFEKPEQVGLYYWREVNN